ncbi:rhamnan synthesis F family protein [Microbacterium sp.]|uniref:rhamnan synthesis F family protein n=1 Tax=Microbacterium sp. TaxID=51671 RepID=UPI0039E514E1
MAGSEEVSGTHDETDFAVQRVAVYVVTRGGDDVPEHVRIALAALRPSVRSLAVVTTSGVGERTRRGLGALADHVFTATSSDFTPGCYAQAIRALRADIASADELLLTGDCWFGPVADIAPVLDRMGRTSAGAWQMVENRDGAPRDFTAQGFPAPRLPWSWTVVRREVLDSAAWRQYWAADQPATPAGEVEFARHLTEAGHRVDFAFRSADFPYGNPALYCPVRLLAAGCPVLSVLPFSLYPPFLQQHAILGREIVAAVEKTGYPPSAMWPHLARTVPAKALNTNAAMLEIFPEQHEAVAPSGRIAVVAYISDVALADELLDYVENVPAGYDLFVTTTDGVKAARLRSSLGSRESLGARTVDIRVTPTGGGGDMGDFFVGCRDVIAGDHYDLIVKIHVRRKRAKTANVRHYFRRYQWDNVLGSRAHVANLLQLFEREPGLGIVFPPMIHIGYATMGRGWGPYRGETLRLAERLGIRVPFDLISPLAPFGATWIARPAALRRLAAAGWTYGDYKKSRALARIQERIVVASAAEDGFHARTVLTAEHAAISHTAIEFKADQLTSTSTGYPVDQITLMHRLGPTGRGGPVGLSRMYLRGNHPRLSAALLPAMSLAERGYLRVRGLRARAAARRAIRALREERQA